jgi:GMP synthase (glutamine-hydrolysing)
MLEKILILDFGSQYTQLIARRIRELQVFSEVKPCFLKVNEVDLTNIKAIILSGGPASVTDADAPEFDKKWFDLGLPILGICYGMQLMAIHFGARLAGGEKREYGRAELKVSDNTGLFQGFKTNEISNVWMSHGDHVDSLPEGFVLTASSQNLPIAAMECIQKKLFAIQFHPEVVHSDRGKELLANFVLKISGCSGNWTSNNFIEESIAKIQSQVAPDANVICGLSGGVDSSVAAVLVNKAIGSKLHCIFVNNGLVRNGETEEVEAMLGKSGIGLNLTCVDASERFLSELSGVSDPEQKRKIIGRVFIEVFDEEAKKIPNVTHLVQGTLYPDVIESVSVRGPSATIKTHHNVGGLPEKMQLKLLEPFRELFKDEVRTVGRALDIPEKLIQRQPFPGPGLAVRVIGELSTARLNVLRNADSIFSEEIVKAGFYNKLWQSFCVLLPVKTVGVMGDNRTYEETIALRAVTSEDGMTADWFYLPGDLLARVSNRIINEVKGVNRVVLDISSKPPATIEWE